MLLEDISDVRGGRRDDDMSRKHFLHPQKQRSYQITTRAKEMKANYVCLSEIGSHVADSGLVLTR